MLFDRLALMVSVVMPRYLPPFQLTFLDEVIHVRFVGPDDGEVIYGEREPDSAVVVAEDRRCVEQLEVTVSLLVVEESFLR